MQGNDETEVLDTTEEEVEQQEPVEEQEQEPQGEPEDGSGEGAEEGEQTEEASDEVVVTIGDEPAAEEEMPQAAAPWLKDLRKRYQDSEKERRELRKEIEALKAKPAVEEEAPGVKPTLEACDYDTEVFEQKLGAWHEKKRSADDRERKKQEEGAKAQAAWQATLNTYNKRKSEFKVSDFAEAEAAAIEVLGETMVCMVVDAADNPEVAIYALGKNPKKAKELAAITNPVKFGKALEKLEKDMKVTPKRTAPLPETTVRGSAPVAGSAATLERLREDARRTGDYSKVTEFNRKQAKKSGA